MKTVNPVVTEVIGLQYGDEGKSNISCLESSDAKLLIRATGGSNSSHTIECECSMYNFRIIPSGIVNKKTVCILGPGMAIDPKMLLNEIWLLKTAGIAVSRKNLIISDRARVILPYHKKLDAYYESLKKNTLTGSSMVLNQYILPKQNTLDSAWQTFLVGTGIRLRKS